MAQGQKKIGTFNVTSFGAALNGKETESFTALVDAAGEFDGWITYTHRAWSRTLAVKFVRSTKKGVAFGSLTPGSTTTGFLFKTTFLGSLKVTLYEDE